MKYKKPKKTLELTIKVIILIYGSILAGDGIQALINLFPINIWFGRIGGILFSGIAGLVIYNSLFNDDQKNEE